MPKRSRNDESCTPSSTLRSLVLGRTHHKELPGWYSNWMRAATRGDAPGRVVAPFWAGDPLLKGRFHRNADNALGSGATNEPLFCSN
jgi:hypothetical protein